MSNASLSSVYPVDNEPLFIKPRISWSPSQLAVEFPHAIGQARRMRKSLISTVMMIQDTPSQYHRNPTTEWLTNFHNKETLIEDLMCHVAFLDKFIRLTEIRKVAGEGFDIARAKMVPISNYIDFNKAGFALCLWHNEKGASMKYYPKRNKVHCFGCGKDCDIIDVIQELKSCSLSEAVKFLS